MINHVFGVKEDNVLHGRLSPVLGALSEVDVALHVASFAGDVIELGPSLAGALHMQVQVIAFLPFKREIDTLCLHSFV